MPNICRFTAIVYEKHCGITLMPDPTHKRKGFGDTGWIVTCTHHHQNHLTWTRIQLCLKIKMARGLLRVSVLIILGGFMDIHPSNGNCNGNLGGKTNVR